MVQWDIMVQWDQMDQWDLMDPWDLMVLWDQMDLWDQTVLWDTVDQWVQMDLWIWDQLDIQWEWAPMDQCHLCLDHCQCHPCLTCQCPLCLGQWDLAQEDREDLEVQWDPDLCQCLVWDLVNQCLLLLLE